MCSTIKGLYNFEPPATEKEIRAAALQLVRTISAFNTPSTVNEAAFNQAVSEVAWASRPLLNSLVTDAPQRERKIEARKAGARRARKYREE